MTADEVVTKLKRYQAVQLELEQLTEELVRTKSSRERMAQLLSEAPKGSYAGGTMLEKSTERILQLEERLSKKLEELIDERLEAEQMISTLSDTMSRVILKRHYCFGETWDEIAEKLYLDVRSVYRIRLRAIREISKNCQ